MPLIQLLQQEFIHRGIPNIIGGGQTLERFDPFLRRSDEEDLELRAWEHHLVAAGPLAADVVGYLFHYHLRRFRAAIDFDECRAATELYPSVRGDGAVLKYGLREHKKERIIDFKKFISTGYYGSWLGTAPDDSPLILRDAATQDVYSLDWEEP